jgi:hypothetical protein
MGYKKSLQDSRGKSDNVEHYGQEQMDTCIVTDFVTVLYLSGAGVAQSV